MTTLVEKPQRSSRAARRLRLDVGTVVLTGVVLAVLVFPFAWMVLTSLRGDGVASYSIEDILGSITFANFERLFATSNFAQYLTNSFIVSFGAMVVSSLLALLAAYAFTRFDFRGKRFALATVIATQLFPFIVLVTPFYSVFVQMRLLNTYQGLILVYIAITLPFAIFLMIGYLSSVPKALDEAAQIDGAGVLTTIFRVILPVAWPGVATVAIYSFIIAWEEYLFARILVTSNDLKTAQVALANFFGEYTTEWDLVMAAAVTTALPTIALFLIIQRRLVSGLTAGGVKD